MVAWNFKVNVQLPRQRSQRYTLMRQVRSISCLVDVCVLIVHAHSIFTRMCSTAQPAVSGRDPVLSLPPRIVTTRSLCCHYRPAFSLPDCCVVTTNSPSHFHTPCCHYQSAFSPPDRVFSLPIINPSIRTLFSYYRTAFSHMLEQALPSRSTSTRLV